MVTKTQHVLRIDMIPIRSTNLSAAGYDKASKTLRIRFQDRGLEYDYHDVPAVIFTELVLSRSAGEYFAEHIRNVFKGIRVG
jgi:KTSC domain